MGDSIDAKALDLECEIAKYITDLCYNVKNITINGAQPVIYNYGKTVVIDFKRIMLTYKGLDAIDEEILKNTYESLIKITIPITNDAIMKAIDTYAPSCNMGFTYEHDFKSGVYKIIIGVKGFSETGIVNEMAMGDAIALLESERDDTKFEYFASDTFIMDACRGDSSRKMRKYAAKAQKFLNNTGAKIEARPYKMNGYKHQFNIDFIKPESIIKGGINKAVYSYQTKSMTMFTKSQIATMKNKVEHNIARLNKMADEYDNKKKVKHEGKSITVKNSINEATSKQVDKQFTQLRIEDFTKTLKDAKRMYLNMTDEISQKYKSADGIYTPGWDTVDWPLPADKFFDDMIKYTYTSNFDGNKYGQFSVVVAEIDNAKRRLPLIKDLLTLCAKHIDFLYRIDNIEPGNVGWYIAPISRNNGYTVSICLNSNNYLIK